MKIPYQGQSINRRAFIIKFNEAIALSRHQQNDLALLFIDRNRFKQLNDTHGHKFGDAVLHAVADTLSTHTRATDTVARLVGDEFTVIMEAIDNDQESPDRLAQKLNVAVAAIETVGFMPVTLSLSSCVAIREHHSSLCADELISLSDGAMYTEKGRPRRRTPHRPEHHRTALIAMSYLDAPRVYFAVERTVLAWQRTAITQGLAAWFVAGG